MEQSRLRCYSPRSGENPKSEQQSPATAPPSRSAAGEPSPFLPAVKMYRFMKARPRLCGSVRRRILKNIFSRKEMMGIEMITSAIVLTSC
ncbi:hypothetical protein AKJ16_DCAP24611 [Drosera capensis]